METDVIKNYQSEVESAGTGAQRFEPIFTLPLVSQHRHPEQGISHQTVCLYKLLRIRCKIGLSWAGIILLQILAYRNTVNISLFLNSQTSLDSNEGIVCTLVDG